MVVRKRLQIEGCALVFVTTTVVDWMPIFVNPSAATAVLTQLRETLRHFGVSLAGYVLMPSHLHALLGFPKVERLSEFMQTFKSLSARAIKKLDLGDTLRSFRADGRFRLWRPRFDDLIIVSEKQFRTKLNYIHENPVGAGLVQDAREWPYSSVADWLNDSAGFLPIDKTWTWNK